MSLEKKCRFHGGMVNLVRMATIPSPLNAQRQLILNHIYQRAHPESGPPMATKTPSISQEASPSKILDQAGNRSVVAQFDGGIISSDSGVILLKKADEILNLSSRLADCFTDHRDPFRIEHTVQDLLLQRMIGIALGYEDLNDHDQLRRDPAVALAVGVDDLTGEDRKRERDKGCPLAGKSTLNRLELALDDYEQKHRYKKITWDATKMDDLLVDAFQAFYGEEPHTIVLDIDATDIPLHGGQENRYYHGYYKNYCYLPLYVTCDDHVLGARLNTSDIDPAKGAIPELQRIIARLRRRWKQTRIIVRGDSGFCREDLMKWCEDHQID